MADKGSVESARTVFAKATGQLEDAVLIATEGQAIPNLDAARQSCDRLIKALEACLALLQRMRRRLG